MTRKDYIALATALSKTRPYVAARSTKLQRAQYNVWHEARTQIMDVLASDNPRFDHQRFIDATDH